MSPTPPRNRYQKYKTEFHHRLPMIKLLAFNWGIILAGLLFQNGFNAISLILVARRVEPVEYGQYVATYALVSFLVILPGFGMDAWLLTQAQLSKRGTVALWLSSLQIRVVLLVIWAMFMVLLSNFLPDDTYPQSLLILTVVDIAFGSVALLSYSALRVQNRHTEVTIMQSVVSILLFIFILVLPVTEDYIYQFAFGRMSLSIFICFVAAFLLKGREAIDRGLSHLSGRQILKGSKPFMPSELASAVYIKADVILVSLMLGSPGTAVYSPALSIIQISNLASRALFFFVVPRLSKTFARNAQFFLTHSRFQLLIQTAAGTCMSFVLWLFAPEIINVIFGSKYDQSIVILRTLSLIPFMRSINFGLAAILISGGYQSQRAKVQIVVAAFNVIAILLMITPYGLLGVALIFNISELILIGSYGFLVWQLTKRIKRNQ